MVLHALGPPWEGVFCGILWGEQGSSVSSLGVVRVVCKPLLWIWPKKWPGAGLLTYVFDRSGDCHIGLINWLPSHSCRLVETWSLGLSRQPQCRAIGLEAWSYVR